jgi:site-specific DNA-methyltransferase (adenine-specific)
MTALIVAGDCRALASQHGPYDLIVADPPYGDTSLPWDVHVAGWESIARQTLKPGGSLWVFGSMRFLLARGEDIFVAGFNLAQDLVWEKHNGSSMRSDRFNRVHEHIVQFYRDGDEWAAVYNQIQTTPDAVAKTARRKGHPAHFGRIGSSTYRSIDGGPRLMRSVIFVPSCHGRAIHPTEKPDALIEILIRTSCPPGGLVGDFFAGSGAAGDAAHRAGRNYVGFELDPAMAARAARRIDSLLPLEAP